MSAILHQALLSGYRSMDYDVNKIVGGTFLENITAQNINISVPAGAQSGDMMFAVLRCRSDRTIATPSGWSLFYSSVIPGGGAINSTNTLIYIFTKSWVSETSQIFAQNVNAACGGFMILVRDAALGAPSLTASSSINYNKTSNGTNLLAITLGNGFTAITPALRAPGFTYVGYTFFLSGGNHFFAANCDRRSGVSAGIVNVTTSPLGSGGQSALLVLEV